VSTDWPRAIAHFDLDQFYAAVEILDFPELKGLPLIVGGAPGNRGVVCTASYEARKFGVHSAMASSQAAKLCPHATWRPPRMSRYAEKSREIRVVFERYTDQIEPLSLDEAFLDLTGSVKLFGPPEVIARRIKDEIRAETGLTTSVGLAFNKFLAKIASDFKKPDGFVVIPPDENAAREFLAPLQVARLWGVGPKTRERLNALGFFTVGELAKADPTWLIKRIGQDSAEHLLALSLGKDAREVVSGERPKSIGRENTFAKDLFSYEDMERELLWFADDVAARLRAQNLRCYGVTLKVRLGDFSTFTRATHFEDATDLAGPLYAAGRTLLREKVDLRGKGVRLLGLSAHKLCAPNETAASLFPDEDAVRGRRAAQAIDSLRERFGDEAVKLGRLLERRQKNTGTPSDRPATGKKGDG
jgi:DNA polymerase-4